MIVKVSQTNKRGAALLTVLVALLLMSLMTLELQYTSLVERKLAYNDLNHLQVHYLAKSGIHLGLLRVVLFGRGKKQFSSLNPKFLSAIWNLQLPAFPPEAEVLKKLAPKEKAEQEEMVKDTRISTGQFSYQISSESSKLNLNLLHVPQSQAGQRPDFRNPPTNLVEYIGHTLLNKIEQIFLASDDPFTEFGKVRSDEIIYNIMDWISPTPQNFASGNSDSWYEQQNPPYKTKRAPFFTLDEVKLVKDMSPALFEKLKSSLTVFSENGRMDLDSMTSGNGLRQLFSDFSDRDLQQIRTHFNQDLGGTWSNVQAFTTYMSQYFPRFMMRYPSNLHPTFFTVGSESFLIKSQGQIKKSGSVIQKNISVAVALQNAKECSEITGQGVNAQNTCETQGGFLVGGRCWRKPTSLETCDCKFDQIPLAYIGSDGGCKLNTSPQVTPLTFAQGSSNTNTSSNFTGVKVYSWVES